MRSSFSEEFLALSRRGGHTIGFGNHSNHGEAHPFALDRSSVRVGLFRRNRLHPREMRHQDNRFRPATALRTCVVLVFAWAIAALAGPLSAIGEISGRSWLFLVPFGLTTGGTFLMIEKKQREHGEPNRSWLAWAIGAAVFATAHSIWRSSCSAPLPWLDNCKGAGVIPRTPRFRQLS